MTQKKQEILILLIKKHIGIYKINSTKNFNFEAKYYIVQHKNLMLNRVIKPANQTPQKAK